MAKFDDCDFPSCLGTLVNYKIAYDTQEFGDCHHAKSWNSILKDVEQESCTK